MGLRTSVYLNDELAAKWRASGVPLAELVRQALEAGEDGLAFRVGRAALRAAGYATRVPTATEVPSTATSGTATQVPTPSGASHDGTSVVLGTDVVPEVKAAAKGKARTRRAEPEAPAVAFPSSLAGVPLTVASALPQPRRCSHPGKRSVGGFCPDCDHLIKPGGAWA